MTEFKTNHKIITLDLEFQSIKGAIAAYLIPYKQKKAILVECGPGSTLPILKSKLADFNFEIEDITHVLLTHIHLDHAGAAGWFAKHGAQILVHEVGAPHMINPERLLRSAKQIYGDEMDSLWGEFLPVDENRITSLKDGNIIEIGNLKITAINTPGHANHHMSYLLDDICFSGDVGGVRIRVPNSSLLQLPTPPPEFHFERWIQSIKKLEKLSFNQIAPTHFGIFSDAKWHLKEVRKNLVRINEFFEETMPSALSKEEFRKRYEAWMSYKNKRSGIESKWFTPLNAVNPINMSADGLYRYWHKYRNPRS